jgi:KUP system potassium uptake protein
MGQGVADKPASGTPNLRLLIGALGVVFGDIGTSPLYAFRESFIGVHKLPIDQVHVFGVLSLIVWALILVVTVKYVLITMHADNHGEGGSFALLALIRRAAPGSHMLPVISIAALMATALFYGDAVITPAISILSAVEGVTLANARFAVAVVPVTVVIALVLFGVQHRGAGVMGRFFGPVMLAWFVAIGGLGVVNVMSRLDVLLAASPTYALALLAEDPMRAFLTLGTVVLTITGAEALYADMGQFGRVPITRAWMALVLPALLACYAGQAALVLNTPDAIHQAFFLLAPGWALWPLLALATAATVIASQSAITGAFSVTAQAIQLGYLPRLQIVHTSADERGQIFAPAVNALLCVIVVGLVLAFRSSAAMAAAYGFAVTSTMVLTTLMMGFMIFRVWRLPRIWAVPLYAVLLVFDLALFAASSTKIPDGAWLPLAIAALMMVLFTTWSRGLSLLGEALGRDAMPVEHFMLENAAVARVPGLAVYLFRGTDGVPTALLQSLKHNHVLHEHVLLVTIRTALRPRLVPATRLRFQEIAPGMGRAVLTFGFREDPDVPFALSLLPAAWHEAPERTSYILGRQNPVPAASPGMARWRAGLFATMMRLSGSAAAGWFRLPPGRVVEMGNDVEI